jgi:putative component of membrane protein insertase Oxa1/YidC/SpoIIIJ protein YidD
MFEVAVTGLIGFYQRQIGPQSVDRCPFWPSCSNFALQAIDRYGVIVGICFFIDRNLYRENPGVFQNYGLVRLSFGRLKLDDRYFLGEGALHEISTPARDPVAGSKPGK